MSDDYSATTSTTGTLQVNDSPLTGFVEEVGDSDWFSITLNAGITYDFFLAGTENNGLLDPILSLYNSTGAFLALDDDSGEGSNSWLSYTPTTSSPFFLGVRGYGSMTGNYQLQATIRVDDQLANSQTAGLLALNTPYSGAIEYRGDHDWLRLSLTAGVTYRFSATGGESEGLADPNLALYNRSNLLIDSDDDSGEGLNALLTFTPTSSGRYYLDVGGFGASTGTYTLEITTVAEDDLADTAQTTGQVTVDAAGTEGTIENMGDVDWVAVTLTAGINHQFAVTSDQFSDSYLTLYDAQGVAIAEDDDGGEGLQALLSHTPTESGLHYLGVQSRSGQTGTYTVTATTGGDDFANNPSSTGRAVLGTTSGTIERAEDQDWFSISLSSSRTYTITLLGAPSGSGTLADPRFLGIHNRDGSLIEGTINDDYSDTPESRITFTPETSGTYLMAVGGGEEQTGTYQVQVARSSLLVDTPANTTTTRRLLLNGQAKDRIRGSTDVDWYRVSLTAGRTYIFEQQSNTAAARPLADPSIRGLYNGSGRLISGTRNNNDGSSLNARVQFTPTTSGTYYLAAGAHGSQTGSYVLSMTQRVNIIDQIGATVETAAPMSVEVPAASTIDSAFEQDWFAVDLSADQAYEITLRGAASGSGTLLDPLLVGVYDATGVLIPGSGNDDSQGSYDARTFIRPTLSGTYYLAAGGFNSTTGSYTLAIQPGATTDLLDNATTSGTMATGETLGSTIDEPGDVDWIRITLQEAIPYRIQHLGAPSLDGSLEDPMILGVYNPSGLTLDHSNNDDQADTRNASVTVTAPASGEYYIAVSGSQGTTGSYLLSVSEDHALADETSPALVASSLIEEESVAPQSNLTLEFNENIQPGSGNVHLSSGTTLLTIPIASNQVSFNGNHLTLNLQDDLVQDLNYHLWIDDGAVVDLAGNAFGDLSTSNTAIPFSTSAAPVTPLDDWTIMVYMAADNNLEAEAIADLNEMEMVNLPDGVNVVTQLDRIGGFDSSNGNWTNTRRGQVHYDFDPSTPLTMATTLTTVSSFAGFSSLGELNMADPANLTSFIDWAKTNHPAQNYALIIWDHGGGLSGAAQDDTSSRDILSLAEMRTAVANSRVNQFDLIGFDACLMGMVEAAWEFRDETDIFVASEDLVPGAGFAYDRLLEPLRHNPTMNAMDLGQTIVSTYAAEYQGLNGITLSSLRTSGLSNLNTSLNAFIDQALSPSTSTDDWNAMRRAISNTMAYPEKNGRDYRDLDDFMTETALRVSSFDLRLQALSVKGALGQTILSEESSNAAARGLSIFLPPSDGVLRSMAYTPSNYSFLESSRWETFLDVLL